VAEPQADLRTSRNRRAERHGAELRKTAGRGFVDSVGLVRAAVAALLVTGVRWRRG